MDIVTQGLLGGTLALSVAKTSESRHAVAVGCVAALLADVDILISSPGDTLVNLEFHRHFTHSLIFIPVGALIAALLLWPLLRRRLEFRRLYLYALLGYATSGLLDACTSYGTHLLWPFSDERIAWSIIAIIDPLFTLILLIAVLWGLKIYRSRPARIGLVLAGVYLLFGAWQHHNALQVATQLAQQRGHGAERLIVKPTMANLLLWRSIYEADGVFY
ncbi:MAG: metal-dependent hydrolase, partial [Gammaproteobacteria bacterium]